MIEWFQSLTTENWIAIAAIAIPVIAAAIIGLFKLFRKRIDPKTQQKINKQKGKKHKAVFADDNKGNIALGDIHNAGIDPIALKIIAEKSTKIGRLEKEKEHLKNDVKRLITLRKTELKDAIKDVVKEVLNDIRNEKDSI